MAKIDFGIKCPADFSPISAEILEKTVLWQFERIVETYPDRVAVKDSTHSLTYRELNNGINHLAKQIIREVGEDTSPVAFLFANELFSIITFMAILKSGRPFMGLHQDNSNEQIRTYLEDSTASLLVTNSDFKQTIKKIWNEQVPFQILNFDEIQTNAISQNPEYRVASNDPFGIFYTSGSTGKPKGVMVGHLYESQRLHYKINDWCISPSDRISLVTSLSYATAFYSVLGAFLSGALLWVFDLKTNTAQKTLDWIINEELTFFRCTPSVFRTVFSLAPSQLIFSKLRLISLSGEPATHTDIELFKAHTTEDCVLINTFAATESGSICHYPVNHHTPPFRGFLPVGYPAPGKEILLLDDLGQTVPAGEEGEIVVRSRFLSLGYWHQPELSAQKFQADPNDPSLRLYFTGDRGRWREDGTLELLGRQDAQIKIRGYRVQLSAIDLALRDLEGVQDAATIVHQAPGRGERLVAYLAMPGHEHFSTSLIRKKLSTQLPDYMIPSAFVQVAVLPRTSSGKLARRELPEPSNQRPELETPYLAPRNTLELQIASIWQNVLGLEQIGMDDKFFELGGDSLLALEMTLEVEKHLSKPIPPAFFKHPTISSLAALFERELELEESQEKFALESYRKDNDTPKMHKLKRGLKNRFNKIITRKYSLDDFGILVDLLIARYIVSLPYRTANQWAVKWSQNTFVRDFIYRRRYVLLSQWMASLKDCQIQPSDAFQMSILTNMSFGLSAYLGKKEKSIKNDLQAYKKSAYPYWRSLGELLDSTPTGELNELFPISGLEHFLLAYQKGKGVILLTFHGGPNTHRFFALERFLGLENIPTISYHIPVWQSQYDNRHDEMSEAVAATLNAEIALFAQRKLQEGKVIKILSDTNDMRGRTYQIPLAGKEYLIKGGFAELALNTGAMIVPHFRHCLPDGRVQLNFSTPLNLGNGDRDQRVKTLIDQYVAFIEQTWATHPEAMRWATIKAHLSRPSMREFRS